MGVFRRAAHRGLDMPVFPTHVEVFPVPLPKFMVKVCLPHARGGVSRSGRACPVLALSSPRTWGGGRQAGGVSSSTSEVHGKGLSSPQLGLFTSALDIDSFIWRE